MVESPQSYSYGSDSPMVGQWSHPTKKLPPQKVGQGEIIAESTEPIGKSNVLPKFSGGWHRVSLIQWNYSSLVPWRHGAWSIAGWRDGCGVASMAQIRSFKISAQVMPIYYGCVIVLWQVCWWIRTSQSYAACRFKVSPWNISKPDILGKEVIIVQPFQVPPAIPMADDTKKEDDVQEIISRLTDTWDKRFGSVGYVICCAYRFLALCLTFHSL